MKKIIFTLFILFFSVLAVPVNAQQINITCIEESTLAQKTTFRVGVFDSTHSISYSTTNGTIIVPASAGFGKGATIQALDTNFSTRRYVIEANTTDVVAVLSSTADIFKTDFSLIDQTGKFPFESSRLRVWKLQGTTNILVTDDYFSASGLCTMYLRKNNYYVLEIKNDDYTRSIGGYTPAQDETISLVVGDIILLPDSESYGGFNYNISKTNTSVTYSWNAPLGSLLEPMQYRIFDSNDTLVYSLNSSTVTGTAAYLYADPSKQYKIMIYANTTGGIFQHTEYVRGKEQLIDLQISDKWYNIIAVFFIFVLGLIFSYLSASLGALVTALITAGLYAIGFLQVSGLIVSLIVVIGLLAIFRDIK